MILALLDLLGWPMCFLLGAGAAVAAYGTWLAITEASDRPAPERPPISTRATWDHKSYVINTCQADGGVVAMGFGGIVCVSGGVATEVKIEGAP